MSIEKEHPKFRRAAKDIVDTLFENDSFKERISRDDMVVLENWLYLELDSTYQSEKKITELMDRISKNGKCEKESTEN